MAALLPPLLGAAPAAPSPAPPEAQALPKVEAGEIEGAKYAIALPSGRWNKDVLLLAHGYRPDDAPVIAELNPERASLKAVLDEGWMVATSSYRRNGLIVGDAITDLDALRAHIADAYGEPERVILEGESMGGLIVVIMAERDPGPYQGAVVFDATLYAKEPNMSFGLTLLPRIPLLFVSTRREVKESKGYLTALVARPQPIIEPALFLINRDGHTNVNQAEHLEAFRALNAWIDKGREALPTPRENELYFDATIAPEPGPSTAVMHADRHGFETTVAEVDPVYGNVLLAAQPADFQAADISPMTYFELRANGKGYRTLYGRTFTDAPNFKWVAFPDADGRTVVSQNFANAAGTAGLKVGDTVSVAGFEPHPAGLP
ncbi:MAG TPA: SAM hydroxide adenosyltransferase [Opitutaceae bacterium]|jgi:pimeloyl-ACP methyl ester carboxylesterase